MMVEKGGKKGFILVEIIASTVVVASLVVIAYMILDKVTASNKKVNLSIAAMTNARTQLETLLASDFENVTNTTWDYFRDEFGNIVSNDLQFRVLVSGIIDWDAGNDLDAKEVTIEVRTL